MLYKEELDNTHIMDVLQFLENMTKGELKILYQF
jgi:hypothetical protein